MRVIFVFTLCVSCAVAVCTQSVDEFINMAMKNNTGLKALQLEYESSKAVIDQKGDYPDPIFSLGLGVMPIETRLGAQRIKLGVAQMIPWKGLLDAQKEVARASSEVFKNADDVKGIDIEYQIRMAYATIVFLEKNNQVLSEKLKILDFLEELSTSAVRSGKGKLSNVLLVQRTREEIESELLLLEKKKEESTITINRWVGRTLDLPIRIIEEIHIPMRYDSLLKYGVGQHPQIEILESMKIISEKKIALTQLEQKPRIGVGLDYAIIEQRSGVNIDGNGRDVLMPMGSIIIPLHAKRFTAKRQEEKLKMEALDTRIIDLEETYRADITRARSRVEYASMEIDKYEKLKEVTVETISLMRTEYAAEGTRFEALLQLEMELIQYDLQILKSNYNKDLASAIFEKYN